MISGWRIYLSWAVFGLLLPAGIWAGDDGSRACVSLLRYKHRDCSGQPVEVRNYTVWTQPGSPCRHTDSMGDNSITNEYCTKLDTDSPELHQKVYVKDKSCHVKWYQKAYSPQELTYNSHKCTYGNKLNACTPGACESPNEILGEDWGQAQDA